MEEKKINTRIVFSVVAVLLLIAVVAGATYAYFSATAGSAAQTVTTATLTMGFSEGELIRATNITPIADSEIKTKAVELPFSITNNSSQHMAIEIKLTDISMTTDLKDIDFRWGLYNADTDVGLSFGFFKNIGDSTEVTIYEDFVIDAGEAARNYKLRVWIHDDGAEQNYMQGESFSAKVTVNGEAVEYTPEECFTFSNGSITDYDVSCGGTDVVIPKTIGGSTVNNIGDTYVPTFSDKDLTSIIIPNTVTNLYGDLGDSVNGGLFSYNNLTNLTIPESVTSIADTYLVFNNKSLTTLRIPESVTVIDDGMGEVATFNDTKVKELVLPGSISSLNLFLLGNHIGSNTVEDLILMDGLYEIETGAFYYNSSIQELEIPSSVMIVGPYAFDSSNITKIIVRGKSSLEDFPDYEDNPGHDYGIYHGAPGLTAEGGLPEGVTIEFRP